MAKKKKTMTDLILSMRNTWHMNPITRVHENEQKNIKKIRDEGKKLIKRNDSGLE